MVGLILPLAGSLAPVPSGGGGANTITKVPNWAALSAPTGSGAVRFVTSLGFAVYDLGVGDLNCWVPLEAIQKSDGTFYDADFAQASGGADAVLLPGVPLDGEFTTTGTVDPDDAAGVAVTGFTYLTITTTASRLLLVQQLHALPGASVAESGVAGGSVVGGQGRWINTRGLNGGAGSLGLYQTQVQKGRLTVEAGKPFWTLLDQSASKGPIRAWSAGGGLGQVIVADRSDMSTSGAYFQVMSVDSGGTGVKTVWDYVALIALT